MAFLDDRVKEVVEAVKAAGDLDRTTFLIVSDHGQETIRHQLRPNILLKQAGLQGKGVAQAAYCIPENGFGLVYQKGATAASVAALKTLFTGKPGVAAALTSAEAAKDGWPVPSVTDQGPDLLLYAANGYSFVWDDTGQYVTDIAQDKGAHGFRNTEPLMQAIFIGSGAGIAAKGEIAPFDNVDVAATIAKLLHVELKGMDGKPLTAILK
jgi:arylsulfatase A-like enzyme